MSDSRQGSSRVGGAVPGPGSVPETAGDRNAAQDGRAAAVLGPFTARDIAVFVGVLITFVGSLLPLVERGSTLNLWNAQNLYFIGIGILLPLVLAALFAWRRLSPGMHLRIGSLSLDQFASVVAAFACSYYFVFAVTALTPGGLVGFVGGAVLVVATILAPVIPAFAIDFAGRAEVPAHVIARDAVEPVQKPKTRAAGAQKAGAQKDGAVRPSAFKPSQESKAPQAARSQFPAAARLKNSPNGSPTPWAGSLASDGASAPEGEGVRGSGVSSAGAAAAATGAAGAAAAGASIAALAAGAMAAQGEGGKDKTEEAAGHDEPIGRHNSGTPAAEAPASTAEDAASTAAAPVGPAADDDVVLGDADGEAYGAPRVAGRVEPTVGSHAGEPQAARPAAVESEAAEPAIAGQAAEPAADKTSVMPSSHEAGQEQAAREKAAQAEAVAPEGASEPPQSEPAPTQASPVLHPVEPEPEVGPATQLAPAVDRSAGFEATRNYEEPEPEYEAFWFAVNHARAALDPESGLPLFTLEPGQWILALQDRGDEFLVQSQDGRIGVLRDLSGIERG
ncbi:SLC5/6 family protein [Sinomonas humi]|uniref:Uncharacterized protein n=1 Tax=Sinomonas humi TaxID=1338436 RepID=A0A0B2APS4_9MICC|nr:hypothetical protein [Sinomonas humi]KHL05413.1 hypothetical protein LK10_01370 [Sinomonas humi]